MKKIIMLLGLALVVLALAANGTVARAANNNQNKAVTLPADQSYSGTFIRSGNTIKIDGKINGDAFLAAQDITIDGEVSGNVYAVAQNITIKGKIGGGLHLAAARIEVSSEVHNSLIAVGSLVSVTKEAKIGGGVLAAGSTVDIAGSVQDDVYVAGSTVTISNSIGGSVTASTEQLTMAKGAAVGGSLTYYSTQDAKIENDTKIIGSIKRVDPKIASKPSIAQRARDTIYGIVSQLLIGLIAIAFLPKTAIASANYITKNPLKSLLTGLGIFFATLVVFIVALMAVFGLPLAIMIALGFVLLVMTATLFLTPFWLGRLVIRTKDSSFWNLALSLLGGVVIVAIIMLLPVLSPLFGFIMFFVSLGALSMRSYERFNSISKAQRQ